MAIQKVSPKISIDPYFKPAHAEKAGDSTFMDALYRQYDEATGKLEPDKKTGLPGVYIPMNAAAPQTLDSLNITTKTVI